MIGHLAVAGALTVGLAVADGCDPGGDRFGGFNDYRKAGCYVTESDVQAVGATGCNYAINGNPIDRASGGAASACMDVLPDGFPGHTAAQYRHACGVVPPNTWPAGTPDVAALRAAAPAVERAPLPSEVSFTVFQYATGDHSLPVTCGPEGHENTGPVTNLVIDRPFVFRMEPRWRGGKTALDVIFEPKVYLDVTGQVDRATWTVDDATSAEGDSQWTQLVHLGAQSGNREMAQIDQDVTFGHGDLLHPMKTAPTKYDFQVDFQLGKQVGPKLVCEAEVRVWRAGDPNIPAGAEVG